MVKDCQAPPSQKQDKGAEHLSGEDLKANITHYFSGVLQEGSNLRCDIKCEEEAACNRAWSIEGYNGERKSVKDILLENPGSSEFGD